MLIKQQRPSWHCHSPLLCNNKGNSLATKVPRGLKMSPSHQSPPRDAAVPHSTLLAFNSPECNSTEKLYNSFKVTAERTLNKTTPFQQDTASEQCNPQRGGGRYFQRTSKKSPDFNLKLPRLKIVSLLEAAVFQKGFKKGFTGRRIMAKSKSLLHLMPAVKPRGPESCWQQVGREALKTAFEALV